MLSTSLFPAGITGNSSLLACISASGSLQRIFWPFVDGGQHLGILKTGLLLPDNQTIWLDDPAWAVRQYYLPGSAVFVTELAHPGLEVSVSQHDFCLPHLDVFCRWLKITNLRPGSLAGRLVIYMSLNIDESVQYDGMYIENNLLVQHRRRVFAGLTIPGRVLSGFHCGRRHTPSDPWAPALRGEFWGGRDNIKEGAAALAWELGPLQSGQTEDFPVLLLFAENARQLADLLDRAASTPAGELFQETLDYWRTFLTGTPQPPEHVSIFAPSLMVMKLLSEKKTGASIAAPEFDPAFQASGGYGYCWPRDGLYVALALDLAGKHQEAADFYRFCRRVLNPDGSFHQRYFVDGSWGSSWGQQRDQVGAVLWGCAAHYRLTGDRTFLEEIWPLVQSGAEHIRQSLGEDFLPAPSMDLWEDQFGQSTYTAAACSGGLAAASFLADTMGEEQQAADWRSAARNIRQAVLDRLWSPSRQSFVRGRRHNPHSCYLDERLDSAVLGLCFPFALLPPDHPLMQKTVAALESCLWNHSAGGLHRYEGDGYAGGNPWVLLTLWLAIYHTLAGHPARARELLGWAENNASPTGLLPEQIHKDKGGPAWVLPLNWSHAMYVLAALALAGRYNFSSLEFRV
ncbi:MAG: glycoside hydrolase family 15 protein [Desulfurispora sp.]|uniref:glycoside hydrolase family 15 protein n=1 Tax=Desulfurispora sp. TaxID=3014275 RepID=UPI00404B38D1